VIVITTLAYDGKVLAADTLITTKDIGDCYVASGNSSKIKIIKGMALSGAGQVDEIQAFEQWIIDGCSPKKYPRLAGGTQLLLFNQHGLFQFFRDSKGKGMLLDWSPETWGTLTGSTYSKALMKELKLNAHDAIERTAQSGACRHTGLPVYSITQEQLANVDPEKIFFWTGTYKDDNSLKRKTKKRQNNKRQLNKRTKS
jgi:hypothetical protein